MIDSNGESGESVHVTVIGGCGHVGLPLALAVAKSGLPVEAYDVNSKAVASVNAGDMPFLEVGADEVLADVLERDLLSATTDASSVSRADIVIVVIGTPVDDHLNPDPNSIRYALEECIDQFRDGQLVILRSTVYPGVTAMVADLFASKDIKVDISFCPERIAEGHALTELYSLPQIVSGVTESASTRAGDFFNNFAPEIVFMSPEEAEVAKLVTNAWRYIKFAAANQFYMMANDRGLDFEKIRRGLAHNYPRARDLPSAGFAAGPCLFKDTMQLAAFTDNSFALGHSAMLVNEGLPLYVISKLSEQHDLSQMQVGILGMSFKAESDDIRSSLSYKLKRLLKFRSAGVVCTDPYVTTDPELVSLQEVLEQADILIIGAPHAVYADFKTDLPIVDIWNVRSQGVRV